MKAIPLLTVASFLLFQPFASSADASQSHGQTESRPNILFVAIDDFNDWGPTQLDGEPFDVDTPHFDSLAAQSILFRRKTI